MKQLYMYDKPELHVVSFYLHWTEVQAEMKHIVKIISDKKYHGKVQVMLESGQPASRTGYIGPIITGHIGAIITVLAETDIVQDLKHALYPN